MTVKIIDHSVPHVSSVPANAGDKVELFVREFDGRTSSGEHGARIVLMLHGRTVPALAGFAFGQDSVSESWARYSWAGYLARSGFDVFVMDLQGSGRSPRPKMDDPYNARPADQYKLMPPLATTGDPRYPYQLNNSKSDIDELSTVANWIREHRGERPIDLIGWSAAAFILGPFAMANPRMVDSLFLLAPIFPPWGLSDAPPNLPLSSPSDRYGFPMTINTKGDFLSAWNIEHDNGALREPGIENAVWDEVLENDEIGKGWGHAGVMRVRNAVWWGWNENKVSRDDILGNPNANGVPVAIMYGEQDNTANTTPEPDPNRPQSEHLGPPFNVRWLYRTIRGPHKLMIQLENTGHSMPWETQYEVLHSYSAEWIRNKSIGNNKKGSFRRNGYGELVPVT